MCNADETLRRCADPASAVQIEQCQKLAHDTEAAAIRKRKAPVRCGRRLAAIVLAALVAPSACTTTRMGGRRRYRVRQVRLGGTLSFTGQYAGDARRVYRGLELLQKEIEHSSPFKWADGTHLTLSLEFADDASNLWEADEILKAILADSTVAPDFLIGPSSTRIAQFAQFRATDSKKLIMMTSNPMTFFYDGVSPYTFTTNVMAPAYMTSGLDLLREAGFKTLVLAIGDREVDKEVCESARRHATELGFEVLAAESLALEQLSANVRLEKARKPDLYLSCGSFETAVQSILTSRALGFSPKGMLIASAYGEEFVRAVGASNANYILAPTSWSPDLTDSDCKVFHTRGAARFAERYREEYGEYPTHQSAQAAAGALALLHAVEKAGSVETEKVRKALLELDVSSFYRRLKFHENGTLLSASTMYVEQFQPDLSKPKRQRHNFSRAVLVAGGGADQSALVPVMRDWEYKEAEVYPCDVGSFWETSFHGTDVVGGSCKACPIGTFRGPHISVCKTCEAGTFGDKEGLHQCFPCPDGANCSHHETSHGRPPARAGYYTLPDPSEFRIARCNPPELCLGNNKCYGNNTGFLCMSCLPGYTNSGINVKGKRCDECPDAVQNSFSIFVVVLAYGFLIGLLVRVNRASSTSVRAIHSVIIKICVNYLQFAGTAFAATNFLEDMMPNIVGDASRLFTPFVGWQRIAVSPVDTLLSIDCVITATGVKKYHVYVLLGLFAMPVTFVLEFVISLVSKIIKKISEVASAMAEDSACERRNSTDTWDRSPPAPSPTGFYGGGTPTPRANTPGSRGAPALPSWRSSRRVFADARAIHTKVQVGSITAAQTRQFIQSCIVCGFVLHPLVVDLLLVSFKCWEYDHLRLMGELDIICNSNAHLVWIACSTLGLLVYGLGFPLVLFLLLYRKKSRLLQKDTVRKYGFLYNGFEIRYYYFESFYMLRKVVILLLAAAPTMYVRMVGMVSASWGFVLLHLHTKPFDNRSFHCLDFLETLNLLALTVTLMSRLVFDMRSEVSGEWFNTIASSPMVSFALLAVPIACHLSFIGFAAWCLFRNSVVKYLVLKAELFPERITRLQKFIIALERQSSKLSFDKARQSINIDALSRRERKFLNAALSETLARYVGGGALSGTSEVRPGLVASAVQLAFASCRRMRDKRKSDFADLETRHDGTGWWSWLARQRGELMLSLQGLHKRSTDLSAPGAVKFNFDRRASMFSDGVTVEELHEALMLIWPEITTGARDRKGTPCESLFRLIDEKSVASEAPSESSHLDIWDVMQARSLSNSHSDCMECQRQTSMDTNRIEEIIGEAATPLNTGALQRQNDQLWEELVQLRRSNAELRFKVFSCQNQLASNRVHTADIEFGRKREEEEDDTKATKKDEHEDEVDASPALLQASEEGSASGHAWVRPQEEAAEAPPVGEQECQSELPVPKFCAAPILPPLGLVAVVKEEPQAAAEAQVSPFVSAASPAGKPSPAQIPSSQVAAQVDTAAMPTLLGRSGPSSRALPILPSAQLAPDQVADSLTAPSRNGSAIRAGSRGPGSASSRCSSPASRHHNHGPHGCGGRRNEPGLGGGVSRSRPRSSLPMLPIPSTAAAAGPGSNIARTSPALSREVQLAASAWSGPFEFLRAMRPADPAGLQRASEGLP